MDDRQGPTRNKLRSTGTARRLGKRLYRLPNANRQIYNVGLMKPAQPTKLSPAPRELTLLHIFCLIHVHSLNALARIDLHRAND